MNEEKDDFLEILNNISPIDYHYSKTGKVYNKFFKSRSLEKIKENFKKKLNVKEFPIEHKIDSYSYHYDLNFNNIDKYINEYISKNKKYNKIMKIKKFKFENKIKEEEKIDDNKKNHQEIFNNFLDKTFIKLKKKKVKQFLEHDKITFDPGRYNPNYNSIYKKSFCAFMSKIKEDQNKKDKSNNKEKENLKRIKNINKKINENNNMSLNLNKNNSTEVIKKISSRNLLNNENKKDISDNDLNELLLFKMNLSKKVNTQNKSFNSFSIDEKKNVKKNFSLESTMSYQSNKKIKLTKLNKKKFFSNDKKNIKSIINYDKMIGRKPNILNTTFGPDFYFYTPKFDSSLPKIKSFKINHKLSLQSLKRLKTYKIIRNYQIYGNQYSVMD